jgi:hypothetical protein
LPPGGQLVAAGACQLAGQRAYGDEPGTQRRGFLAANRVLEVPEQLVQAAKLRERGEHLRGHVRLRAPAAASE